MGARGMRWRPHESVPAGGRDASEENHRRRYQPRPSRQARIRGLATRRRADAVKLHPIDRDRLGDVLDSLRAHRLEAERQLFLNLVRHLAGNAKGPRLSKLLESRGDVDALAVPVRPLDNHLTQIDPDAHIDAVILREAGVPLRHPALDLDGAFDRVDNAPKLGEKAVAHEFED